MKEIKVGSAADEIQYRLSRLREMIPHLQGKRIVVYGTGINTRRVLKCLSSLKILGLMDDRQTGKYIYGKKVLSEDEIQLLGTDTILIAAESYSTEIIYKRIVLFCMDHHISLLDMYGCDELQYHKNILRQELLYPELNEEALKSRILQNDALLMSFQNVLCSEIISDEKSLYEKVGQELEKEGIVIPNFSRYRKKAAERIPFGLNAARKEIYHVLSTMLVIDKEQLERIREIEIKLTVENLVPRIEMIELLKCAISHQKDVYIYSDLLDGELIISSVLQQYGITQYKKILADKETLDQILGRAIRALSEAYGNDRVICIGNDKTDNLIIPQLYHVDFQLILSSHDMFLHHSRLQKDWMTIEDSLQRESAAKEILHTYNSPFLQQVLSDEFDNQLEEKLGWSQEEGITCVELYPMKPWDNAEEIEKIDFPKISIPQVSIIIWKCSQFQYIYNCLKSILHNSDNVTYEVIIIDDGLLDVTWKLDEIVSGAVIIHNHLKCKQVQDFNGAAAKAKGKYLLFLNAETQVQLNWLYPLVKCMENRKDAGLIGPRLVNPDGSLQAAGGIVWKNAELCNYGQGKNPDSPDYGFIREVDYISTDVLMISKALWNETGGFDEGYLSAIGYRDADLAYEVRKRGKSVLYQPESSVVQFGNISSIKEVQISKRIKENQERDKSRFLEKWGKKLCEEQYPEGEHISAASERKQKRRTVLFVSEHLPTYDRDAGSRTIDFYIQEFIQRGYIVKFIPGNFAAEEPYTQRLQQMGIQVFSGKYYQKNMINWICACHADIDFAFLNYPNASSRYIDILKKFGIPVMYYGVDLHYLRLQREYDLLGDISKREEAEEFYQKEAYLIQNSDVVYYPSLVETEIVREKFQKQHVRQLMINIYDTDKMRNVYQPEKREGLLFVGGYRHTPNVDAVKWFSYQIFPRIYEKLGIPFYIVGVDMPVDISGIDIRGIKKIGALSDSELEEMYANVKMVVVPLRYGAGIKGKVIEALYHGIPVVTTPIGIEGIPNDAGAAAVAGDEESFAEAVAALYDSHERLKEMSVLGQEVIRKYYSREAAWSKIEEDFR